MIPTPEQVQAMQARGWEWVAMRGRFYPTELALAGARITPSERIDLPGVRAGLWQAAVGDECSELLPLSEAADWVRDELRKVAMRSPIFAGLVEARWERTASRLWMLYIGTCPVVAVWEEASKFTFSVYGMGRHAATWEEVKTWVARFGLPPLPADAWEVQGG